MPRAFLVVKKKKPEDASFLPPSVQNLPPDSTSLRIYSKPDYEMAPPSVAVAAAAYRLEESRRPSPVSSPCYSTDEPHSPATSEIREGRVSPPSDPHHIPFHTGALMGGVFDLSHKRRRLDSTDQFLSPKSLQSDSGSELSSASPPPENISGHVPNMSMDRDRQRYHLLPTHPLKPTAKDPMFPSPPVSHQAQQVDQEAIQPLSPLHHLVRQNAAAAMLQQQGYPGFPAPGFPLPFMRAPFFMPHHFRPYAQLVPNQQQMQAAATAQQTKEERSVREEAAVPVRRDNKRDSSSEKMKSTKPKISHNIEDLLARSPPKKQRTITEESEQPTPVVIQPQDSFPASPIDDSPIHQLVAMDRLYAQSPRHLTHHSNFTTQSPKTASFAPEPAAAPMSPRCKSSKTLARNLEQDFKKQYLETLLPEALRQQQKLAEDYKQLSMLRESGYGMQHHSKERRACVPDIIKQQQCFTQVEKGYMQEFPRETVFPHRHEESKEMSLAERLSPSALEAVPVDFSKSSTKKPGPPRFQCDGCKKSYSTLNGLSKHKEFHCVSHVKKEFSCKHCAKTYTSLGALKMHIRTHTLPCKCHLCGKAFSRPWLLQGHIRTHTGEKPFSCQHCSRSFADRSNLRAHLQTHTDVKRYSCNSCTKTFSRMSLLTKHRENGCAAMHHR